MNNTLSKFMIFLFLFGSAIPLYSQTSYTPPPASRDLLKDVNFSKAVPIDENYRKTFADCDNKPNSHCRRDKNNLNALLRFPDGTIFYESKMSLDLDGSFVGCGCAEAGKTDQCQTAHQWTDFPTDTEYKAEKNKCKIYKKQAFVDAGKFPYFVLPLSSKFVELTHLKTADLAIVVYEDKMFGVFVGDRGPTESDKIGEGSAELLRLLGKDKCIKKDSKGNCTKYNGSSIEEGVLAFIFPNSRISGLKRETAVETIKEKALKRFEDFKKSLK